MGSTKMLSREPWTPTTFQLQGEGVRSEAPSARARCLWPAELHRAGPTGQPGRARSGLLCVATTCWGARCQGSLRPAGEPLHFTAQLQSPGPGVAVEEQAWAPPPPASGGDGRGQSTLHGR